MTCEMTGVGLCNASFGLFGFYLRLQTLHENCKATQLSWIQFAQDDGNVQDLLLAAVEGLGGAFGDAKKNSSHGLV